MSEHLIAARAALADEARDLNQRLNRIRRALAVLDDEPTADTAPLVRPPAPSVPAPPVELPKRETRPKPVEQRPAAKSLSSSMQDAAKVRVDCPGCGKSFSQLGFGSHKRGCHGPEAAPTSPQPRIPLTTLVRDLPALVDAAPIGTEAVVEMRPTSAPTQRPSVMPTINAAGGPRVLMCDECEFEVDWTPGVVSTMSQHCLTKHQRGPSIAERTPVPRGGAA